MFLEYFTTAPYTQFTNPTLYSETFHTTPFIKQPSVTTLAKLQTTVESVAAENAFNFDSKWFDITNPKINESSNGDDFEIGSTPFDEANFLIESTNAFTNPLTTPSSSDNIRERPSNIDVPPTSPLLTTTQVSIDKNLDSVNRLDEKKKFFDSENSHSKFVVTEATTPSSTKAFETNKDIFNLVKNEEIPRRLMETADIKRINISSVELSAICLDHGINVTFMTKTQVCF